MEDTQPGPASLDSPESIPTRAAENLFTASHSWITNFKLKNKITSWKTTKFTTVWTMKKIEEVQAAVLAFQAKIQKEILPNSQNAKIFNFDQCDINYEQHSGHTFHQWWKKYWSTNAKSQFPHS